MANDLDECSFCGRIFEPSGFETFTFISSGRVPEKHVHRIPVTDAVYALVDLTDGQRCICERCYITASYGERSDEELAAIHVEMAGEYLGEDRLDDAERCCEQALQRNPGNDTLAKIVRVYDGLGNGGTAVSLLEQLRDTEFDHHSVVTFLPTLYLKANRQEDALYQIRATTASSHYGYDLVMGAAEALWRLGRQDEAADAYDAALQWSTECCTQCADLIRERWTDIQAGRYT